ncbi:hypothetical protein BGZ92_004927 [Podila epicladia]|nr:hypothetical protein BGZ92_004927 [Podila epicladia]
MFESGDMYFGLSRAFFGTPQDGAMNGASSRQIDRQANTGSPAMDIGAFFQEPTPSSSSRLKHHFEPFIAPAHDIHASNRVQGAIYKHPTQHRPVRRHHNAPIGTPEMHLDTVFKEPAWYTSSSSGSKKAKKALKSQGGVHSQIDPFSASAHFSHPVTSNHTSHQENHSHEHRRHDEEEQYMNHQPTHGHHSNSSTIYKHPTQHRPVHRHHNAPVGTPEMNLDTLFQEPAWYTTAGAKGKSKKAIKKAAKKAAMREELASHHVDPFNAPVHPIHPVASHAHSSHHVDEEGYYMNHQPIHGHHLSHHDVHMFSIPSSRSALTSSDTSSHQRYDGVASRSWTTKNSSSSYYDEDHPSPHDDHNEEGYYMNHQPINGHSHHDSTHGAIYRRPTQHRAVHRHHNAPIGTPEMHLESVFKEPKAVPIRSAPHNFCTKDCVDDDDYEIGYEHIHDHHSYQGALDRSRLSEEGYYMDHQPIQVPPRHGSSQEPVYKHPTQHRAVQRHHNAPIGTPEMHLDDFFKEPAWYTSSSAGSKGKKADTKRSGHPSNHVDASNIPVHVFHPVATHSRSTTHHADDEGYYRNRQPILGHTQPQHHDWDLGPAYKHPAQHVIHHRNSDPIGIPEMHSDAIVKELASNTSLGSSGSASYMNHQPTSGHHVELHSHAGLPHITAKKPQGKLEDSAVWNLGSLLDDTPSWAMTASLPKRKPQTKVEDSTAWNLGSLLDDTPSWAMNAHLPMRKSQRKVEDSTVWNLGSLFDDTISVHSSKSGHTVQPSSSTSSSSSSRHQSRPLTVDQIARVATPIGHTVTYTTVIRTTVTLMGAPSSLAHDMQHVQAEREHVLTEFSGPVSLAGQTAIWVRKESSEEMFEGDQVVCQSCRRSWSRL